jgi:plastocyanin
MRARALAPLLFPALLVAGACSGSEPAPASESAAPAADASSTSPSAPGGRTRVADAVLTGSEPYASATLGALHGTVLFEGTPPERFPQGADKSADCKHHPEVDQRQNIVVVNDGKLAGAFVRLASGYDEATVPALVDAPITLDQKGCMYVPRVLGLRVGQTLRVTNLDPTAHNVHAVPRRNDEVNRNMGRGQTPIEFRFERAERPVPFKCDIHPWMGAAVFVEEHPWFAVSDASGAFRIRDVPPGEYVVEAVHEKLGKVSARVTVAAGQSTGFTLKLSM